MIITLLGGAGFMGAGIVRDLVSDRTIIDIGTIHLCDASREKMEALANDLGDPRIALVDLDVTDAEALKAAIAGADLCINCVPTLLGFQMTIFEAALALKVPYMDLGGLGTYTVKQLAEDDRFKAAGVPAVIGCGADPGMSNVICRAVADELDEIDRINLYWAAELVGDENPVLVPPYSVSTVLAEYAHPSTQFYDGKHVECPPMSGSEFLDLPEPWGRCEFMHSPHSEQLTVPLADGIREKGIREFSWKLHLPHREHEAWVGLVKAGFGDFDEPVEIGGVKVKPLDVLNKVIERNIRKNAGKIPAQDSHEIHFAIGRGRKGGVERTVRVEVTVSPDDMYGPYVDACTSMNGSIAAQLILALPKKPGVHAPESYFDVATYFPELEKRKFRIAKFVE
ncbi:saccharopine dehydrogenase NADP-binding domain-containing protein [Rhizobium sp. S95]|uniref:Saccharopine dehydrogenase NADP-binding domain-containing protein n=1 Tax=Ciceribacter sichuanensis TaxID=2949647 RepID=A0AAJ1BZG0_9HYPH|nr:MULTISPECIES: saccharopine dehydrogenase NADP-binding domain-containing protein [unclassified Ciceribacter]MCM2397222.1 saccharopine dehydrogenase NADP-binding domain-containing protein [Ciceribacter sp. S95]MCO5959128.1 saccharopine dehydrogenase NADP-binding domain-containing protein [Ciceribacter sp. S101]